MSLRLTSTEHSIWTNEQIDSLPYVDDRLITEANIAEAERIVREEMRRMPKREKDYLLDLRAETSSSSSKKKKKNDDDDDDARFLWEIEYERRFVKKEQKSTPDIARYDCQQPIIKDRQSVSKWEESVSNVKAQLEHTQLRMQNLELMQRYGGNAWRKHCEEVEKVVAEYERMIAKIKDLTDGVNARRKMKQEDAGKYLAELETTWLELTRKCVLISESLAKLEHKKESK